MPEAIPVPDILPAAGGGPAPARRQRLAVPPDAEPEVVAFAREVVRQHRRLRRLVQDVLTCPEGRCDEAWQQLRSYLAAHEAAEQLAVHPLFRARDRDDLSVVDRLSEEADIISAMTLLDTGSPREGWFRASLVTLCELVTTHADREEREELPGFLHRITEDDAAELLEVLLLVEEVRDTLPGGGTPFADLVDGAQAELDRLLAASRGLGTTPA